MPPPTHMHFSQTCKISRFCWIFYFFFILLEDLFFTFCPDLVMDLMISHSHVSFRYVLYVWPLFDGVLSIICSRSSKLLQKAETETNSCNYSFQICFFSFAFFSHSFVINSFDLLFCFCCWFHRCYCCLKWKFENYNWAKFKAISQVNQIWLNSNVRLEIRTFMAVNASHFYSNGKK